MKKTRLEMLLIAAAAISPQLVVTAAEAAQVKHIEQMSAEEVSAIERPADYFCAPEPAGEKSEA